MAQEQLFPSHAKTNLTSGKNKYDLIIRAILRTISTLTRKNLLSLSQLRSRSMSVILSSDPMMVLTISDVLERATGLSSFSRLEENSASSSRQHQSRMEYVPLIFGEIMKFFLDDLSRDETSAMTSSHLLTMIATPNINLTAFNDVLYSHLPPVTVDTVTGPSGDEPSRRPSPITITVSEQQEHQLVKLSLLFSTTFSADDAEIFTKIFKQNLEYQKLDL
jgi:hypothetical protein